ncbi:Hypothetical protein PACV_12 [Pacmanvirus A23]|uniref:Hypothetical protein n=1 Tax=Pacmanvirus A23 TaxID=1932881 RepID=UPI000A095D1C|nr:Hypothetical protein B9W72_gp012 [Pacmanvirus A23]SIP85729.1 Hypothetical protein PACV_12 [Pacmanvirus A23]
MSIKIITNQRCNSQLYSTVIKILDTMTGLTWGFVRNGHRIQYVSCAKLPVKVGAVYGHGYEKLIKWKLDIEIKNKAPYGFESSVEWLNYLSYELQSELLKILRRRKNIISEPEELKKVIDKILETPIDINIKNTIDEAESCNLQYTTEGKSYDVFIDDIIQTE